MPKRIFISYSRRNTDFAEKLTLELQRLGAEVWFDQHNIKAGSAWDSSIDEAIDNCDIFLLVCSKASVESENVLDEVGFALSEKKTVIPVLVESCDLPFRVKRLTSYDLSKNMDTGMNSLLHALSLNIPKSQMQWEELEQVKEETLGKKKITITAERKWWSLQRKRSLFIVVLIALPILTDQLFTINMVGLLGLWFYFLIVLLSLLIATGLRLVLKRSINGKRFIKRYGDVFVPGLLVLFTVLDSLEHIFITTPAYFLMLFILVVTIPRKERLNQNVDYFVNLIGLILFTLLLLIRANIGSGSLWMLPSLNLAFAIGLAGSALIGFLSSIKPLGFGSLKSYVRLSFFCLFIVANFILDAVNYGEYRQYPLYLLFLIIGLAISQMARNIEWNLNLETSA